MKQKTVLNKALRLANVSPDQSIELALCLTELRPLTEFIERSSVTRRKAYYLAEVGRGLRNLEVSADSLDEIGWTKLKVILRHLDKRSPDELVELARKHSTEQLKRILTNEDRPAERLKCVVLYFSADQYAEFETAVLANGAQRSGRGIRMKEQALISLIREGRRSRDSVGCL